MISINKYLLTTVAIAGGVILADCGDKQINSNNKINHTEMKKNVITMDTIIKLDTMGYPIVSKEFETFDFETYEERPPENSELGGYRESQYIKRLSNGIVTIMNFAGIGLGGGFYCIIFYPDSYFLEWRLYYANGNIKEKGLRYNQGFQKGIWYEFDETGKLIKETNYDAPFQFTFEDIVQYCKKNEIKLQKGYEKPYENNKEWYEGQLIAKIYRKTFEGVSHWEIQYKKEDTTASAEFLEVIVKLDGKTGKELSKTVEPVYYRH